MKTTRIILTLISLMLCIGLLSASAFAKPPMDVQPEPESTSGNVSPFPTPMPVQPGGAPSEEANTAPSEEPPVIESVPPPTNPFTPPGTGTVVDNATDDDGKEFFTIITEDGNVFFLIIDRQRGVDNVYFLSAVTEEDLLSFAQQGGRPGGGSGTISAMPPIELPEPETQDPPEIPENPPEATEPTSGNRSLIPVLIAVVGAGGAAYYFKIVRGQRNDPDDELDEDDESEYSDDEEVEDDYGDEFEDEEDRD